MKIQEETDVKEYQIRKKKSREQTVENMENKEKAVRETEPETTKEEDEHVKEMGMLSLDRRRNHQIELLTIIGEVEGHETVSGSTKATKYEHLLPKLAQIENSVQTDGVLILLNTLGGDVEAGLAIAEMIASLSIPTVSLVLGGGHSIGVPLACSAKQSFIAPSATMTVHPVRMNGLVLGVPQTLSYFDRMQERIVRFVTDNSGISSKDFRRLMMNTGELVMDVGTVLDGEKAVQAGLIDHLGGLSEAISCLYRMIEKKEKGAKSAVRPKKGGSRR